MAVKPSLRLVVGQAITDVEKALLRIIAVPFLWGEVITEVAISTSTTEVFHRLGRQPVGWVLLDNTADSRIWRVSWDKSVIVLDTSATTIITLWVF